jgi:hypothetical protein
MQTNNFLINWKNDAKLEGNIHYKRNNVHIGDAVCLEDGGFVFFPGGRGGRGGAFSGWQLAEISELLKILNTQ